MTAQDLSGLLGGDVLAVAPRLLGCRLATALDGETTEIVITEVEAYGGVGDPASHAYRGRTPRNAPMYDEPGTLYVYRSYGIHWCANVVTGPKGEASAVLIRGGHPVAGIDRMRDRRERTDHLTDGPGKVCAALGITGDDDGSSLVDGPVRLVAETSVERLVVEATPRIGISRATERPWRFVARTSDGSSLAPT